MLLYLSTKLFKLLLFGLPPLVESEVARGTLPGRRNSLNLPSIAATDPTNSPTTATTNTTTTTTITGNRGARRMRGGARSSRASTRSPRSRSTSPRTSHASARRATAPTRPSRCTSDGSWTPGRQFNRKKFSLSFGLKNSLRFRFDSETCLNYPFFERFLSAGNLEPKL